MSIKSHSTSSNSTKRFIKATTTGSGLTAFQEAAVSLYANIVQYQFLMVGGGGSVNQPNPGIGGGGAGSFIQGNIILQKNVSTNVVIGAGAASSPGPLGSVADRGNESWLKQNDFAIVALGGGRSGVPAPFNFTGYPGGSGGGGSITSPNPGSLVAVAVAEVALQRQDKMLRYLKIEEAKAAMAQMFLGYQQIMVFLDGVREDGLLEVVLGVVKPQFLPPPLDNKVALEGVASVEHLVRLLEQKPGQVET